MKQVDIPRFVDSQLQIFWWEMDEFVVAIGLFMLGIASGTVIYTMLAIPVALRIIKKFKRSSMEGGVIHAVWWAGVMPLGKQYKDSAERFFY